MTASDFLIQNGGRLDPSWFEPHDLNTLLAAWLSAASGSDQAVEAQVYARGFETLVDMVMTRPARVSADDVTEAYSDAQLKHWQQQAAAWRSTADALTGSGRPALTAWEGDSVWRN